MQKTTVAQDYIAFCDWLSQIKSMCSRGRDGYTLVCCLSQDLKVLDSNLQKTKKFSMIFTQCYYKISKASLSPI